MKKKTSRQPKVYSNNKAVLSESTALKVHPKGIEPLSEVPETSILSIELQVLMQFK